MFNDTKYCMAYLWDSRATSIWSKYLHQGNSKEGKAQGPEDVHDVVHDVRTRTLKSKDFNSTNLIYSALQMQALASLRNLGKTCTGSWLTSTIIKGLHEQNI